MTVKIMLTLIVRIDGDQELVEAFLNWCLKNRIWSVREGGGYTGQGGHVASYYVGDKEKIAKFFGDFHTEREG